MACERGDYQQPFPRCPWALDLSDKPFPGRAKFSTENGRDNLATVSPDSGIGKVDSTRIQIEDIELIRDHNLRAMYGAWDALKNVDGLYPNHRLGWVAFIAGKRESRRLMGDVVLDCQDFTSHREFPDAALSLFVAHRPPLPQERLTRKALKATSSSPTTRVAKTTRTRDSTGRPTAASTAATSSNLFMAGRDISVTQDGARSGACHEDLRHDGRDCRQSRSGLRARANHAAWCLRKAPGRFAGAHAATRHDTRFMTTRLQFRRFKAIGRSESATLDFGPSADVTQILSQIEQGDPKASAELLPLVYDELRKLAAAKMAH